MLRVGYWEVGRSLPAESRLRRVGCVLFPFAITVATETYLYAFGSSIFRDNL